MQSITSLATLANAEKRRNAESLQTKNKPLHILLAEDVMSDALLTNISLKATNVPYKLATIRYGDEVIPYLKSGYFTPDLMMLDLGLPCMDGFEVLADLAREHVFLREIPIAILTGLKDFEYIKDIYPLNIVAHIGKPCDSNELRSLLQNLRDEQNRIQIG